ncbi:MAG TPA: maturase [Clostridia bacterium]|nr:maturase [Clostridia bacterium]
MPLSHIFPKVNREKTNVAYVNKVKFLGYSFYIYKGEGCLRIHPKSIQKLKDKIREVTGRSNGMGVEERRTKLNQIVRGWTNYFKLADAKNLLAKLDEWLRSRIRMVTWKRWKKIRTRFESLKKLGISKEQAWMWANTRKGYWRVAHSPILMRALSNERFKRVGYLSFRECHSASYV